MNQSGLNHNPYDIVMKVNHPNYFVLHQSQIFKCGLSKNIFEERVDKPRPVNQENPNRLFVGDYVSIRETGCLTGEIIRTFPRKNTASRRFPFTKSGGQEIEQILAVNLDLIIAVFAAARPDPHWPLLDRYLAMAEIAGIPATICITKVDLTVDQSGLTDTLSIYQKIGYPAVLTSSKTGEGIPELMALLEGKVSLLLGKSGVGKSSILNALFPTLNLRTTKVGKESGKGKHTTTCSEMLLINGQSALIDSPGLREFGLWMEDDLELAYYFPEFRPFLGQCKFRSDCQHMDEPGCAVRKAVVNQIISPHRYQGYLRIIEDRSD